MYLTLKFWKKGKWNTDSQLKETVSSRRLKRTARPSLRLPPATSSAKGSSQLRKGTEKRGRLVCHVSSTVTNLSVYLNSANVISHGLTDKLVGRRHSENAHHDKRFTNNRIKNERLLLGRIVNRRLTRRILIFKRRRLI